MPRPRRNLAALLLAATLLVPGAASAAPRSSAELHPASPALLTRFWSLLAALWADEGCIIDPNGGRCAGKTTVPTSPDLLNEGCGLDPSGRCGSNN